MRITRSIAALMMLVSAACDQRPQAGSFTDQETAKVGQVLQTYSAGWERMDSTSILALFTDDAVISPSGREPIQGIDAIRNFWFPGDGTVTEVHSYDIDVLSAGGSGDLAWTHERGSLSFTVTREDMSVTRDTRSIATTLYRKLPTGEWKIFRRMWTDLRFGD